MRSLYMIAAGVTAVSAAADACAQDGQVLFNNACRTCHTVKPGDNRLGPSLSGVVGRKAGTTEGYQFSASMKNSGLTWDQETLDKFIADPDAVVSSNNMKPFTGIESAEDRGKIIEYLASAKD